MKNDLEEIKFELRQKLSKFKIIEKLRYIYISFVKISTRRDKLSGEDKTGDDQSEVREARRKA